MPVVQVSLDMPAEILAGIAQGLLKVNGSVVRDLSGAIVAHLQEVKPTKSSFDVSRFTASLKDPRVAIGVGVVAFIALGVTVLVATRKKPAETAVVPEVIVTYNETLSSYLIAINTGTLSASVVEHLDASLDALAQAIESGEVTVDTSASQRASILTIVRDYTKKFAEANHFPIELEADAEQASDSAMVSISSLRHYLHLQRRIIDSAE